MIRAQKHYFRTFSKININECKNYETNRFFVPLLLCNSLWGYGKNDRESKMNIVYIMTDDHSYQTISAYGGPLGKLAPTPNLDRLAAKGMLFNEHLWKILFPLLRVRV